MYFRAVSAMLKRSMHLLVLSMVAAVTAQHRFNVTTALAYYSHGYFTQDPVVTNATSALPLLTA